MRTSCIAWCSSELFTVLGNVKCHFIKVLVSHIFLINNCSTCQMPFPLTSTIHLSQFYLILAMYLVLVPTAPSLGDGQVVVNCGKFLRCNLREKNYN